MKTRYIIPTIVIIYLAIVAVATVYAAKEKPEAEHTPTPTATYASNCEKDKHEIQTALNAYYDDNSNWPTADGQPGDMVWDELVPKYMSEMPVIDDQCDWQVSGNPEGNVCVAHTC
jgi:hypothetical protein